MLYIDASGHPDLLQKTAEDNVIVINPTYEMGSASSLSSGVEAQIRALLEGPFRTQILQGNYVLVLPGLAAAATVMISVLHGLCGHFPHIMWSYRSDQGFALIQNPLPLQNVRDGCRSWRFN